MNNLVSYKLSFMIKPFFVIFLSFFIAIISFGQQPDLQVRGSGSTLYTEHVVIPKENFYSIGRTFNVPPKEIAAFNNLQFEDGLNVGQLLKIPLTEFNFVQNTAASPGEALIPVYHSVEPKEGLYRISVNYNKVPLTSLKSWNHLHSDEVGIGTPLIVGYLKVDKDQSYLASNQVESKKESAPPAEPVKKTEQEEPAVVPERPVDVESVSAEKNENTTSPQPEPAQPKVTVTKVKTKSNVDFSGGYFKKLYSSQVDNISPVNENGSAGVFKSTSGWQDGKYYCFNNDAAPGTVIKITDNSTGKSVFAKVLDAIPEIKQNEGLSVIVSNSAAEELGAGENRFDCALSYAKN